MSLSPLCTLLNSPEYCDLLSQVNPCHKISVHMAILAALNAYFKQLFLSTGKGCGAISMVSSRYRTARRVRRIQEIVCGEN